jgi:hypothetical protein
MCCPLLKAKISRIEESGWIQTLQQRLLSSEEYLQQMVRAHEQYAEERWSTLSPEDIELMEISGWMDSIRNVGVAGIRDFSRVKCLHCHYAHYITRPEHGNVVGSWVHQVLMENNML